MASLSLPRVLHPKKTSLDIVRENIEKAQAQALQKAINYQECPVKQKHVRSAIIGTFQTQSGKIFWNYALRLPYLDDRIVAWKLCHVVHKILREGHPLCLVHSQRHRMDLEQMGNLWGHLHEGYGKMIKLYTALLINKLEFHRRNPRFPGHLGVSPEELESIGGNDVNNYFDITIEMFDYLDHILALQKEVLGSLSMSYASSMTSTGQCRLAPLIPCIQDASKLYDYCVKILFKLHSTLPPDILSGHRTRFLKLFRELKEFYERSSNLQYFKDLIAIPPLPEKPVNFLIKSDFGTYITQEVVVPEEKEDPVHEETLIDTTDGAAHGGADNNHFEAAAMHVSSAAYENIVQEKDFLKTQCDNLRGEINALMMKNQRNVAKFQSKFAALEQELNANRELLEKERILKDELLNQSVAVAQNQDAEHKQIYEKFEKLKNLYVKLRDEHLTTLRKIPEVEKKLVIAVKEAEKMQELKEEKERLEITGKEISEQLQSLQKDKELFNMETEILRKSISDACKDRDSIQQNLQIAQEDKETFKKRSEELSDKLMELEQQINNEKDDYKLKLQTLINSSIDNSKEILSHGIHEIDNPAITAMTCSSDYLRGLTKRCEEILEICLTISYENHSGLIALADNISHRITTYILLGRATCNTSPDITFGEKMAEECKSFGYIVLKLLEHLKQEQDNKEIVDESLKKLHEINSLAENISLSILGEKAEHLADMLENEMLAMDKAIEEAANRIQEMLTKSRAADSGIKLEVNEKILDSCTTLMQAIRMLVKKSRLLQAEIVAQGKGTASAKEFYKRNHQWTDGFISAAKAVGVAAQFLLTAADKVVTKSNGKLEHLVVAAQEISASTAQLVVASRVKADRHSDNLKQLTQASKGVTTATGAVVATVKDCGQLIEETEELDVSNLNLHQAKRLEIEAQVRVLELEKELEQERYRLAKLRRHHYQLAGEDENNAT